MSYEVLSVEYTCDYCGKKVIHDTNQSLPEGWLLAIAKDEDYPSFLRLGDTCCPECEGQWIDATLLRFHKLVLQN